MTRYSTITDLRRNISPDVQIVADAESAAAAEVRAMLLQGAAGMVAAATVLGSTPTEHDEQAALFAWAAANEVQHPELCMLHATPNGGYRPMATAAKLKAEGVKAGYPDISLDVARGRWHGLRVELKRADHSTRPSEAQLMWMERLRYYGYSTAICYGAQEAQQCIMAYLSLDARAVQP